MSEQKFLRYEFSQQGTSDDDGFNDGGTTQFDQDIPRAVARESIQNVLDARDKSLGKPALVKFDLTYINSQEVLECESYLKIMRACVKSSNGNPQSNRFFSNAVQHLENDRRIPVLRISDFNTVGLTGADEDPTGNYRNFLKAAGSTNKIGNTGGSFGLGKGALIAASSFRTIFVASRFGNGISAGTLFQGKCRLISHEIDGIKYRGMGSFGLAGERPVRDESLIPNSYLRSENGTDIYILGLRGDKHWKEDVTKVILDHFWRPIQKGSLDVEVEGQKIDSSNIEKKIFEVFDRKDVYRKNESNPIPYYLAYKDGRVFEKTLPTIGKVQCRILAREGYPNQMYCMRATGMKIEQRDYRSVIQYAGVFECDNEQGDNALKLLEPPNHNEWNRENTNAKDPEGEILPEAKKAYAEFYSFTRECVASLITKEDRRALPIGGLAKYVYLPSVEGDMMGAESAIDLEKAERSDHETGTEGAFLDEQRPIVTPPRKLKVTKHKDTGNSTDGKAIAGDSGTNPPSPSSGGGGGTMPGSAGGGSGAEGDGEKKIWLSVDVKHRAFAVNGLDGKIQHVIILRGAKDKEYFVQLLAGTDDNYAKIPIKSVMDTGSYQTLQFKDNLISGVKTDATGSAKLAVLFEDNQQYSLNVGVYES
ncbi:MAG: hypothetical protein PHV36_10660 [Elusimicrobiales bacterium]|nr:hypothetical protein [Elusimicrobiales bacterium]